MSIRSLFVALPLVFAIACGDDGNAPRDAAVEPDAAVVPPCVTNPQTYLEIINACTTAVQVMKISHPPLLNPDGTLPPLP